MLLLLLLLWLLLLSIVHDVVQRKEKVMQPRGPISSRCVQAIRWIEIGR